MQAAFQRVATSRPNILRESYHAFAGHPVRVRIVGRRLADEFCRPFAHLDRNEARSAVPSLTIDLCDEEEAGIARPKESTSDDLETTWSIADGLLAIPPDGRLVYYRFRGSETWLDRAAQQMIGWTASSQQLTLYERGKPMLPLLAVWYHDRGVQLIHAGLVSKNGHGVLFPGMGGAGKSTSALACVDAGFDYLGDDYIGLQACEDGSFVGHSLYDSIWLEPGHMARFPLLPPNAIHGTNASEDKSLVLLSQLFPKQLARSARIRVLAWPRVVNASATRFRPASKDEVLPALIRNSLHTPIPRLGSRGLQRLARLVEQVPIYWLELGQDLTQIPRRVDELLAVVTRS